MSDLLRFEQVACDRGGRRLFERLDLVAGPGQAIEIVGPNGSGKSSLLRLAAGLLEPSQGKVDRRAQAGLVDDRLAFDATPGLGEALAFWAKVDAAPTKAIAPALDAMEIGHLALTPVRMLSTGQRKRGAFARLIASPATLWLLDEPLNGLDADGVTRVTKAIRAHLEAGKALLYASHQSIDVTATRIELAR